MSITSKNVFWMLGLAAGSAVAFLATTKNSKKVSKTVSKSKVGGRYSIKNSRNLYDDSEIYYI